MAFDPVEKTRQRLLVELGLAAHEPVSEMTEGEWAIINRAVDLVKARERTRLEVGMHYQHLFAGSALVAAGIVTGPQLAREIAEGRFDGQLCSLPLPRI